MKDRRYTAAKMTDLIVDDVHDFFVNCQSSGQPMARHHEAVAT